jgi:FG-GAP-like repeat
MKYTWVWLLGLAVALLGCSTLGEIPANVCGNGIVDPGEDCDGPSASCGAPASDHPCRFLCEKPADCPAHYDCGHDGVCREPTGNFSKQASIPTEEELSFAVADVDDDGNVDIVGLNQGRWLGVDYLGSSGLSASTLFRSSALPFAVGQLTSGDERADIVHLPGAEVGVLTGQADRTLLPEAYAGIQLPPNPVLFIMDAIHVTPGSDPNDAKAYAIFGGDEIMGLAGNQVVSPLKTIGQSTLFAVPESSNALAPRLQSGQIPIGHFDQSLPCQQFVLADQGSKHVSVYTPCTGPGVAWNANPRYYDGVTLPGGAVVTEGVIVANLNGDPYPDLVIAGTLPPSKVTNLYVAYGVGDGTFNSTSPPPSGAKGDAMASLVYANAPGLPLAAGDLNGDGIDDFVLSTGVAESTSGTCVSGFPPPWCANVMVGQHWTHAAIADLNANGKPDIIAVSDGARYVEFYSGTGDVPFNESDIPTDGYPAALQVGDFDGDGINDVAVVVANDSNACSQLDNGRADSVSVLFGSLDEPPLAPVSMGTLACVEQLAAGNLFFTGVDLADELAALSVAPDGKTTAALFHGSTDRQLNAPFLLLSQALSTAVDFGVAPQVGAFEGSASHDIAVLALSSGVTGAPVQPRLWLLPATGDAALTAHPGPILTKSDLPIDVCTALTAHADLDEDDQDELVLLGRPLVGTGFIAVAKVDSKTHQFAIVAHGAVTSVVLNQPSISRYACSGLGASTSPELPDFADATQVQAADLDGDGKNESVLVLGPSGLSPKELAEHVLQVFRWAGSGQPITDSPVTLPATRPDGIPFDPLGFTVMNADSDPAPEIVFATADGAFVGELHVAASITVSDLRRVGTLAPPDTTTQGVGIGGVLGVRSGDFNGDGVPDFVVGTQSRFDLFYGVPRLP